MISRKRTSSSSATQGPTRRRKLAAQRGRRLPYTTRPTLALRQRPSISEVKCFDCNVAGTVNMPLWTAIAGAEPAAPFVGITEVNNMRQGATVAERIGNKVVVKSIHLKGTINLDAACTRACVRIMLVYDRQPNGAFPAVGDLTMDQPGGTVGPLSSLNIANKGRFSIIRDQWITLDLVQKNQYQLNLYCKGRWETEFQTNTFTIGDIRMGSILLAAGAQFNAGGFVTLTNSMVRVRYFD